MTYYTMFRRYTNCTLYRRPIVVRIKINNSSNYEKKPIFAVSNSKYSKFIFCTSVRKNKCHLYNNILCTILKYYAFSYESRSYKTRSAIYYHATSIRYARK